MQNNIRIALKKDTDIKFGTEEIWIRKKGYMINEIKTDVCHTNINSFITLTAKNVSQ